MYSTARDGSLVAELRGDRLDLPAFTGREEKHWLRKAGTLTELRAAAREPERVVEADPYGRR